MYRYLFLMYSRQWQCLGWLWTRAQGLCLVNMVGEDKVVKGLVGLVGLTFAEIGDGFGTKGRQRAKAKAKAVSEDG